MQGAALTLLLLLLSTKSFFLGRISRDPHALARAKNTKEPAHFRLSVTWCEEHLRTYLLRSDYFSPVFVFYFLILCFVSSSFGSLSFSVFGEKKVTYAIAAFMHCVLQTLKEHCVAILLITVQEDKRSLGISRPLRRRTDRQSS